MCNLINTHTHTHTNPNGGFCAGNRCTHALEILEFLRGCDIRKVSIVEGFAWFCARLSRHQWYIFVYYKILIDPDGHINTW